MQHLITARACGYLSHHCQSATEDRGHSTSLQRPGHPDRGGEGREGEGREGKGRGGKAK